MKKIISIILILCITACGAVPKSTPPDSVCIQEKQKLQACESQKQTCREEKKAYQTILEYALAALGFATIGYVAGKN